MNVPFSLPASTRAHVTASRWFAMAGLLLTVASVGGCRLCADCDLDAYPSYGGSWQRTVRDSGRVGSVFDPGGSRVAELDPRTDPEAADAGLRQRADDGDVPEDAPSEEEGDLEQQFRENQQPRPEADEERELEEMQQRFRDLQLEDIHHVERPDDGMNWN